MAAPSFSLSRPAHLLREELPDVPLLPLQVLKGEHPRVLVVPAEVHVDLGDLQVARHDDLGHLGHHHVLLVLVLAVRAQRVQYHLVVTKELGDLAGELLLEALDAAKEAPREAPAEAPRDAPLARPGGAAGRRRAGQAAGGAGR